MKTILLTGVAGFICSHLADFLLEKNYKVVGIDNLSTGNIKNISHLLDNTNFKFLSGDICDIHTLRKACFGVDMISHHAAVCSVQQSIEDPSLTNNSNVNGFLNVLLVAKEQNIKRIVYASSSSVYGDDVTMPKKENIIGTQLSPYSLTKYIDELYGNMFTTLYGMECIGLRYFNVFGPRQDPYGQYSAVIPKFIDLLKSNKRPTINGDGSFSRDFVHIDNIVSANYLALTTLNDECFGQIFNIGCGTNCSILDLFNVLKKYINSSVEPLFVENRIGDIDHSTADITKAKKYLGYSVVVEFEKGIQTLLTKY